MIRLSKQAASQAFAQIPEFPPSLPQGGIESRRILEQLNDLGMTLDAQANHLDEWRERTIKILLLPLVDEDEGLEVTGDEYEESTKTQEEVLVNVQALRTVIEDRYDALTGQENLLFNSEAKTVLKLAEEGGGPFPEKVLELFKIREQVKPSKEMGSIRGIISDLRALATTLKIDAENGNSRAAKELTIVEQERQKIQKHYTEQNRTIVALRQEIDIFTTLMNNRLEYYRQLQQLSDMVAPLDEDEKDKVRENIEEEEERLARKIAISSAKRRYLIHLRDEANADPSQQRLCVICQSTFEFGALTVCGHQFCKECMGLWWNAHRNCPVCKRKLTRSDLHDITYKPQELRVAEEIVEGPSAEPSPTSSTERSAIYSDISNSTLAQIKNIDLNGPSFTTKVDTLARHLLWLRDSDPGAKSIIFSQFKEFLDILGRALASFRIGFTTIDRPGGIEQFKEDPGIECFLLHAKAHSSGLNLVNASHVFLCEPLINTALELQAIARVHRIGQQQATTVWLYIIDGTVEDSIYQISVRRRLEHLDRSSKGKAAELTAELLDSSNSMELQHAPLARLLTKGRTGGEVVDKNDLWSCLFGSGNRQARSQNSEILNLEIRRHLGAEAAEQRYARNSLDV
jgi:E3 ubiquitin-protein ligase SHPRH